MNAIAIITASINSAAIVSSDNANTVGEPTFYGFPVIDGLSGGISRRYEGKRFVRVEEVIEFFDWRTGQWVPSV